jgi:ABC-type microcin C transport system permease subunit YejE
MLKSKAVVIASLGALIAVNKLPQNMATLSASVLLVIVFTLALVPLVQESLEDCFD